MALPPAAAATRSSAAVDRGARSCRCPTGRASPRAPSFLLTFLTAYIPLTRQVALRAGRDACSCYAAAGGVGTAAIQVARALGASVVAAVGSAEKLDVCRELGAEEAYVYDELPDGPAGRRRRRPRRRRAVRRVASRGSGRSASSSRSATPAGSGPSSSRRTSSAATSASRASTSAGCCATTPDVVRGRDGELLAAVGSGAGSGRSSARSCRSPRWSRRTSSSSRAAASARSCSFREGARHRRPRRHRRARSSPRSATPT